jgi:hypothetical protein
MSNNKMHQLLYTINHIFLPPQLPQKDDHDPDNDRALCAVLLQSAKIYRASLPVHQEIRWNPMVKMLQSLFKFHDSDALSKDPVKIAMRGMQPGGMLPCLFSRKRIDDSETC